MALFVPIGRSGALASFTDTGSLFRVTKATIFAPIDEIAISYFGTNLSVSGKAMSKAEELNNVTLPLLLVGSRAAVMLRGPILDVPFNVCRMNDAAVSVPELLNSGGAA